MHCGPCVSIGTPEEVWNIIFMGYQEKMYIAAPPNTQETSGDGELTFASYFLFQGL